MSRPQVGAQPYNLPDSNNDPIVQVVNDKNGVPAIQIRGPGYSTTYRLVRISDLMELEDCGSLAEAQTRAALMASSGEVA